MAAGPPPSTPMVEAAWAVHLSGRTVVTGRDDSQWVFADEWHEGHPVFKDSASHSHRLYRQGEFWYYTKAGGFTRLAQARADPTQDPHLPAVGFGWQLCKDLSPVAGIDFSISPDFIAALADVHDYGDSAEVFQLKDELPMHLTSLSGLSILDALRDRMSILFYVSSQQLITLSASSATDTASTITKHLVDQVVEKRCSIRKDSGTVDALQVDVAGGENGEDGAGVPQEQNDMASARAAAANSDVEISSVLNDILLVNEVLAEFCDTVFDRIMWNGPWYSARQAVVQRWLADTVVAGACAAVMRLLAVEVETVRESKALQEKFKQEAYGLQKEDKQIYTSAMRKELKKDHGAWLELLRLVNDAVDQVKAVHPTRPPQPGLLALGATVLDLKHQAAMAYVPFSNFMRTIGKVCVDVNDGKDVEWRDLGVADALKPLDISVTVAPKLKRSARIVQKIFLRGAVASICDVTRALVSVPDIATMQTVHIYIMGLAEIDVVDFKDRLHNPTDGGWTDLVYLVRVPGGYGHICEIQLALQPMLTARKGMHGHEAYGRARHLLEVLTYLGIDCTVAEAKDDDMREEKERLELLLEQRDTEIVELKHDVAVLREQRRVILEAKGRHSWTPLILAAVHGDDEMVQGLLANGANSHATSAKGNTALICAATNGSVAVAQSLLTSSAAVDVQNADGHTALMCASREGMVEMVALLLEAGAAPSLQAIDGRTAATMAHPRVLDNMVLMAQLLVEDNANAEGEAPPANGSL